MSFMQFVLYLHLSLLFVVVCMRYHVLFTLFVFFAHSGVQHILYYVSFFLSKMYMYKNVHRYNMFSSSISIFLFFLYHFMRVFE